jgi:hypothetical protein
VEIYVWSYRTVVASNIGAPYFFFPVEAGNVDELIVQVKAGDAVESAFRMIFERSAGS